MQGLLFFTETLFSKGPWPDNNDVTGVIIALCRALTIYNLSVRDFSKGIMGDIQSEAALSIAELEYIARNRHFAKVPLRHWSGPEYALAIEFQEVAHM